MHYLRYGKNNFSTNIVKAVSFACVRMKYAVLICLILLSGTLSFAKLIQVQQGYIEGRLYKSRNGTIFNAFLGIPYAESPVDNLRFKPPVKAKSWIGIFNATIPPIMCIQSDPATRATIGGEDCLNLNVYTPIDAKAGDNIPVLAIIYGGAFKRGSSKNFGPEYVMNKRIIMVIPNYRLGALGFLTTADSVIPANLGLKDQTLALKWINNNIAAFGGDPNRITLMGHSSGGMSVHLHTLSPLSKGLFNQVIIMSGSSFSEGSYFDKDTASTSAKELAKIVGCEAQTSEEMLNCLMKVKAEDFPVAQEKLYVWDRYPEAVFRPTVEPKNESYAFLTEVPVRSSYQSRTIPWLTGMTTGEGAYRAARFLSNNATLANEIEKEYKVLLPITVEYVWTTKAIEKNFISKTIMAHYFKNGNIDDEKATQLMDLYTAALFGKGVNDALRKYEGPKFVYLYDYVSNYTTQNILSKANYSRYLGISHSDDIVLILLDRDADPNLTKRDIAFGDELIARFVNFAYSGNPNEPFKIDESMMSRWNSVRSERIEYLRLKFGGHMETDYCKNFYPFWKNLPTDSKYY